MGGVIPSQFYSQVGAPPASGSRGPTPQERQQQLLNNVRPLLQTSAFAGAQSVQNLVQRIADFGALDVDPSTRLEILTKIRDGAGNPYFRAWVENVTAMDVTRDWLKAACTAKGDTPLVDTTMPLLHVSS